MNSLPTWLPPIISLPDFDGDPIKYIDHAFSLFEADFINSTPVFKGKKVLFDRKDDNGKPQAFVHITTEENKQTGNRELCLRRCERIAWIKPLIENHTDPAVLVWEKEHSTKKRKAKRTYLFLEKEDFLVILQEIKWGHYMITAIYVDNPNQKAKHLKAYKSFTKSSV
jgi:hypothetical protein